MWGPLQNLIRRAGEEPRAELFLAGRTGKVGAVSVAEGSENAGWLCLVVRIVTGVTNEAVNQEALAQGGLHLGMP